MKEKKLLSGFLHKLYLLKYFIIREQFFTYLYAEKKLKLI